MPSSTEDIKSALTLFSEAIQELASINKNYDEIVHFLLRVKGKIVFMGVGKSGHLCAKLAATFTSTGTPSIFVHPTEASHGDMGVIEKNDVIIMLSASGATQELLDSINYAKSKNIPIISITKNKESFLANNSEYIVLIPSIVEACTNNLAPTTSTISQLAVGDALAVALQKAKNFLPSEFKAFHPGGKLGSILANVTDIMLKDDDMPLVHESISLKETILMMTSKQLGCCGVVNSNNVLVGIFTDGDLRRMIDIISENLDQKIDSFMVSKPYSITADYTLNQALEFLGERNIPNTFVIDDDGRPRGIIHVKQLT